MAKLPEAEDYESLRESALEFVDKVRQSGAEGLMSDAETALAEFAGTRGAEKAKAAADALIKLLSDCNGMCDGVGDRLKFAPGLGNRMGNTLRQLLGEMGLGGAMSGSGEGSGSGYSMRRSTMQNMGLYGQFRGAQESRGGGSGKGGDNDGSGSGGSNPDQTPTLSERSQTNEAGGAGDPTIPLPYRKRVGQYFQRLAEELGDTK